MLTQTQTKEAKYFSRGLGPGSTLLLFSFHLDAFIEISLHSVRFTLYPIQTAYRVAYSEPNALNGSSFCELVTDGAEGGTMN